MYERYYGLRERPFELTSNPSYLFLAPSHREALCNLRYGIGARRGVTLLIGEAGTGKTTLVRSVLDSAPQTGTRCVYLSNPTLTRNEFVEFLASSFDLSVRASVSKTSMLSELEGVLHARCAKGVVTTLLVDEAQALPLELLEEVRLLANMETNTVKLLPIVLAGQPQLAVRLNQPELRQLKQRVSLRCDLKPLTVGETAAYVARRLHVAGGDSATVFTREAIELVHACSGGIPRTISVICDNALLNGFAADQRPVGVGLVREVAEDFDLRPPARTPVAVVARPPRRIEAPTPVPVPEPLFSSFTRTRRFSFF